jgi:hypothetical protein
MTPYGLIQLSKEKDRHREEVAASGDAAKIEAYAAAEKKEAGALLRLAGSVVTRSIGGGVNAVKDMWDATDEQYELRRGLKK